MTDRVVAARRFVDDLVRAEQLEVRRAAVLATDLAAFVDGLKRPPTGVELEDWLGEHKQVEELYASRAALEEISDRYFRPPAPETAAIATNPELEHQLRETLEPDAYLVYADWLQERGDPFGELIALGVAATRDGGDAQVRFDKYLEQNEKLFLRGLRKSIGSLVVLRWHNGFITHVGDSESLGLTRWKQLLDLRVASQIRSVELHTFTDPEVDALIAERVPALRELRVRLGTRMPEEILKGAYLQTLAICMDRVMLDETVLPAKLVRLELEARELVRPMELVELGVRELVLHRSMWRVVGTPFTALAGMTLPNLELLEFDGLDGTFVETCEHVLDKLALPKLRCLVIRRCRLRAADVARLVASRVARQLAELVLQDAQLTDDAVAPLAGLPRKLAHLDIDGNELTPKSIALAKTLATKVVVGKQREPGASELDAIRTFAAGRIAAAEAITDVTQWSNAGIDGEYRWARYAGTDEYELFVSTNLERYGCSCPSSYQPCKHVIALALVATRIELPRVSAGGIERRVGIWRYMTE